MSKFLLALLISGSFGGWIYYKLDQKSLARGGKNLVGAIVVAIITFIVVLTLAAKFLG